MVERILGRQECRASNRRSEERRLGVSVVCNNLLKNGAGTFEGLMRNTDTLICVRLPADSPQIATLFGSPLNLLIYSLVIAVTVVSTWEPYMALNPLKGKLLVN